MTASKTMYAIWSKAMQGWAMIDKQGYITTCWGGELKPDAQVYPTRIEAEFVMAPYNSKHEYFEVRECQISV